MILRRRRCADSRSTIEESGKEEDFKKKPLEVSLGRVNVSCTLIFSMQIRFQIKSKYKTSWRTDSSWLWRLSFHSRNAESRTRHAFVSRAVKSICQWETKRQPKSNEQESEHNPVFDISMLEISTHFLLLPDFEHLPLTKTAELRITKCWSFWKYY